MKVSITHITAKPNSAPRVIQIANKKIINYIMKFAWGTIFSFVKYLGCNYVVEKKFAYITLSKLIGTAKGDAVLRLSVFEEKIFF